MPSGHQVDSSPLVAIAQKSNTVAGSTFLCLQVFFFQVGEFVHDEMLPLVFYHEVHGKRKLGRNLAIYFLDESEMSRTHLFLVNLVIFKISRFLKIHM